MPFVSRLFRHLLTACTLLSVCIAANVRASSSDETPRADENLRGAIIAAGVSCYEATRTSGSLTLDNATHRFRADFHAGGVVVTARSGDPEWRWSWRTIGYGRSSELSPVLATPWIALGRVVSNASTQFLEWYENRGDGLEQGFTVATPPPGSGRVRVVGRIATQGLRAREYEDGLAFVDDAGGEILRYRNLQVRDAQGRLLPASASYDDGVVTLAFDDTGAHYPVVVDPVLSTPAWTAESNQVSAYFGTSVSTAGDVNGDGYSDVLVGADFFDNGEFDEGRAFLYLGSASGVAATPAWTAEPNQAGANFGGPLAYAGDVNGDGFGDVIVGAHAYSNGESGEGAAFVYLGSPTGLGAAPAWSAEGNQAGASFGYGVSAAGDVNGDGYDDVLVGAPNYDAGQADEGRAFLYLGSPAGLAATPAWTAEGNQVNTYFGTRAGLTTAGDVNGDGFDDVIVGAPNFDNTLTDEGYASVYLGSAAGLAVTPVWTVYGNSAGALFGQAVNAAGDVNGDGFADVIVGAFNHSNGQTWEGRAYVFYGTSTGVSGTPAWVTESNQANAFYGFRVSSAGDVNGDGFADVMVGAPLFDAGQSDEGRVFLYTGSSAGLTATATWSTESNQAGAETGWWLGTAGDVNGDGFSDVVIGTVFYNGPEFDEGQASVFYGSGDPPASVPSWIVTGTSLSQGLGNHVASAGDVNGDGYSDVLVADLALQVELFLGSPAGLPGAPSSTLVGTPGSGYGTSCAGAGDVNGDGYDDIIVGAPTAGSGGAASVYLGSPAGLSATAAWTVTGAEAGGNLGGCVAGAGDVNGDGFADVLVSAPLAPNGLGGTGRVSLYSGSAAGLSATPTWISEWSQSPSNYGACVASAGDVNRDGFSDVIVGVPRASADAGTVLVFHGSVAGLSATPATSLLAPLPGWFGQACAGAGDLNGDGYSDVLVGAYQASNGQSLEGAVFAYLGSATGLSTSPVWTLEGGLANAALGFAVASAGDVNGDGLSDVLVGAPQWTNGQPQEGLTYVHAGTASGVSALAISVVESNKAQAFFGTAVASAGDVNGDGFGDVLTGAPGYNNGIQAQGRAFLAYGGGGDGLERPQQQRRVSNTAPIASLGRSDDPTAFRVRVLARSAAGRARVRLEWEEALLGSAFLGGSVAHGTWIDSGAPAGGAGSAVTVDALAGSEIPGGLQPSSPYHWRARVASRSPLFPHTPWLTPSSNAASEADVRTAAPVAAPPPIRGGDDATWIAVADRFHAEGQLEVAFSVARTGSTRVGLFDASGRCLALLVDQVVTAGTHTVRWSWRDGERAAVSAGIFWLRLASGEASASTKVVFAP